MKILFISSFYKPHNGGVEQYIFNLSQELIKDGHQVTVLCCNTEKVRQEEKIKGVKIIRLSCFKSPFVGSQFPLLKPSLKNIKLFKKTFNNQDIVNIHVRFYILSFVSVLYARFKKIRVFATEHGSCHTWLNNPFLNIIARTCDHTLGTLFFKLSNGVIATSKAAGEFTKHLGAKNYSIIYNSIDPKNFIGKLQPENQIIFIGRLVEQKGIWDLVEVFEKISPDFPKLKLVVIGDGPEKKKLEKKKNPKILLLGNISNKKVIQNLYRSNLFVNPSYSEGISTTILEALACNVPVIATDTGGTKEIPGIILYKPRNLKSLQKKIINVLSNQELKTNTFEIIKEKFSWEIQYLNFIKLCKKKGIREKICAE
ncbi:hypothetical protein AUK11_00560 [bacterium CG2_30_37_16]|nr:MAG: hypothetical protein AUK11_00560 [bacterium CG2_30_37_16]PIP30410.1 MAG: hypothetical protein COX25_04960 [bacterium (Candidatus Howlettbacteria) CG23_combo_of_CG06-09_8_20_14_all_37_9]PIY00121.1 MAG: hypothetical protein COZ22_01035 [bacterium (Candidatus Howlettbacteria) CG_4_10_14_3_um_filter_37_10]PJB05895.1 MAG: hypothetical protein CO123_03230 [bacterium (Candidatus Howlettbacteria) CG_4_9_14_3_um_filter_37_10]